MQYKQYKQCKNNIPDELRVFCPCCGELEVKDGEVIHPEMDKLYVELINNSFSSSSESNMV